MIDRYKFRGQRVDNKEWVYGVPYFEPYVGGRVEAYIIGDCETKETIIYPTGIRTDTFKTFEVIPETVGQYTGLKDKNGVEIYEGDILRNGERGRKRYEVVWLDGCLYAKRKESSNTTIYYIIGNKEYIVIGNIHENPELLS